MLSLRLRAVAASTTAVAALLALSACGGDEKDPLKGVAAPAAPTASATPTPTLAAAPDSATKKSDEGAKAFAKYYFETVINEAYVQGKVDKLVEMSDPKCVVCRATVGDIAYFTIARQAAQGGKVSVSGLKIEQSGDLTTVKLTYAQEKLLYKNLDGSTAYSVDARSGQVLFVQLTWDAAANSWKARQIVDESIIKAQQAG
ncbi:MAG: DUF6318 family protein [Sporichthyaceae bacterium]